MTYFIITDETTNQCNSCCCKPVSGAPGEIERWNLDLAPWAVPIGGKGISEIVSNIRKIHTPTTSGASFENGAFTTPFNTAGDFDLSTLVNDAGSDPVSYEVIPFYGPHNGKFSLNETTGLLSYTPLTGYSGYDSMYVAATVGKKRMVAQILIGVEPETGTIAPAPAYAPSVAIPDERISLNKNNYLATMAVVISPAAVIGEVYRITLKATALDCDCNPFVNLSCYDLTITKC